MILFSSRLPLTKLADWCRSLATSLGAGLTLVQAFESTSRRGDPRVRQLSSRILEQFKAGEDLVGALKDVRAAFPPLFLAMANVSSESGYFPEALKELEKYFRFQLRLRRRFMAQIFWPVFQLVAAILVIALVIYIMGIIASTTGGNADILGFGLVGATGAMIWLGGWGLLVGLGIFNYWLVREWLDRAVLVDSLLLRIPVLGQCLRLFALSRFCFALHMTMESGMPTPKAMRLSLDATDNAAFSSLGPVIAKELQEGMSVHDVLLLHHVFPSEFLEVVATAEESGTIPESMLRLSTQYNELAEHQMELLNTAAGWVVWSIVAIIIIFFIFRIVFVAYLTPLNEALKMTR